MLCMQLSRSFTDSEADRSLVLWAMIEETTFSKEYLGGFLPGVDADRKALRREVHKHLKAAVSSIPLDHPICQSWGLPEAELKRTKADALELLRTLTGLKRVLCNLASSHSHHPPHPYLLKTPALTNPWLQHMLPAIAAVPQAIQDKLLLVYSCSTLRTVADMLRAQAVKAVDPKAHVVDCGRGFSHYSVCFKDALVNKSIRYETAVNELLRELIYELSPVDTGGYVAEVLTEIAPGLFDEPDVGVDGGIAALV